jgi:ferredoxin/flavodoxin---NADP+ reductase
MIMEMQKIAEVPDIDVARWSAQVVAHRRLSDTAYALELDRNDLSFEAGRLLTLHGRNVTEDRSYTIASGEQDATLTILYRLVPSGILTPQLVQLQPGDSIDVSGPYGQFVLRDPARPIVFIATGTGIAPCRAYLHTHPNLNLTLIHGVRTAADLFFRDEFSAATYVPCLSAEQTPDTFSGRVTDHIATRTLDPAAHYYLCGAFEMIYEMQDLLAAKGVPAEHIFNEGYYYRLE